MVLFLSLIFSKNVFVFFDGTWNDPTSNTNIYKLFNSFPGKSENNDFGGSSNNTSIIKRQNQDVAIYVYGLGTTGDKTLNGVQGFTGLGIEGKIEVAYDFLVKELGAQDSLRVFGFSRGSETARVFSKYLNDFGISKINLESNRLQDTLLEPTKSTSVKGWIPSVVFLGVFDTVRSVKTAEGTVGELIRQMHLKKRAVFTAVHHRFSSIVEELKDIRLALRAKKLIKYSDAIAPNTVHCAHAVAINEYRSLFNYSSIDLKNKRHSQIYFAGSHGDIGGGNIFKRSIIALDWILQQGNIRSFFPDILPAGFNAVQHALDYPIFDSYSEPLRNVEANSKADHFFVPVFYRNLQNFTQLLHPSVIPLANLLHANVSQMENRAVVQPILRLRKDYASGNTSITHQ